MCTVDTEKSVTKSGQCYLKHYVDFSTCITLIVNLHPCEDCCQLLTKISIAQYIYGLLFVNNAQTVVYLCGAERGLRISEQQNRYTAIFPFLFALLIRCMDMFSNPQDQ